MGQADILKSSSMAKVLMMKWNNLGPIVCALSVCSRASLGRLSRGRGVSRELRRLDRGLGYSLG